MSQTLQTIEQEDSRLRRSSDGRLKSNFERRDNETPAQHDARFDLYTEQLRRDIVATQSRGDLLAARRMEIQLGFEQSFDHSLRSYRLAQAIGVRSADGQRLLDSSMESKDRVADLQNQMHSLAADQKRGRTYDKHDHQRQSSMAAEHAEEERAYKAFVFEKLHERAARREGVDPEQFRASPEMQRSFEIGFKSQRARVDEEFGEAFKATRKMKPSGPVVDRDLEDRVLNQGAMQSYTASAEEIASLRDAEDADRRLLRNQDGTLRSNFRAGTDDPAERQKRFRRFESKLREDSEQALVSGDIALATRLQIQADYERASMDSAAANFVVSTGNGDKAQAEVAFYEAGLRMRQADNRLSSTFPGMVAEQRVKEEIRLERQPQEILTPDERMLRRFEKDMPEEIRANYRTTRNAFKVEFERQGVHFSESAFAELYKNQHEKCIATRDRLTAEASPEREALRQEVSAHGQRLNQQAERGVGLTQPSYASKPKTSPTPWESLTVVEEEGSKRYLDSEGDVKVEVSKKGIQLRDSGDAYLDNCIHLANEKYPDGFRVSGPEDFKKQVVDRCIHLGLDKQIANPELQDTIKQRRAELGFEPTQSKQQAVVHRQESEVRTQNRAVTQKMRMRLR